MANKNNLSIRASQVIAPFGVGSLVEVEGQSFFISGTKEWRENFKIQKSKTLETLPNFRTISLPSLTTRLGRIKSLKQPLLSVKIYRFPSWHFCRNCREMSQLKSWLDVETPEDDQDEKKFINYKVIKPTCKKPECKNIELTPMRFVAACEHGHIADIDWYWWAHRKLDKSKTGSCDRSTAKLEFHEQGKGGGDFTQMHIICSCSKSLGPGEHNDLEGINKNKLPQRCLGKHLGDRSDEKKECMTNNKPTFMEMLPRGAMKLHYPLILSALDINTNNSDEEKYSSLLKDKSFEMYSDFFKYINLSMEEFYEKYGEKIDELASIHGLTKDEIFVCLEDPESYTPDNEIDDQEITQTEILQREFPTLISSTPTENKNIKTIPEIINKDDPLNSVFKKIVRIERLREVRVFKGFQRINTTVNNTLVSPDLGHGNVSWLPACEVFGEGIFLEINDQKLQRWYFDNKSVIDEITAAQIQKANEEGLFSKKGVDPSPQFILIHTLSHLLISQLVFECGYSSTSLKERIYSNIDTNHFGLLIYTSDADSEGAMGGLTEMGNLNTIREIIYKAVSKSRWCSNDPVCRELTRQGVMGLNGAACHACSMIAETSCDHNNILLTRLLVSGNGMINGRGRSEPTGFFNEFLNQFEGEI